MTAAAPPDSGRLSTPARALDVPVRDGVRVLRDGPPTPDDGTAAAVLRLVSAAADLGSDSDELIRRATSRAERTHVDPARANVLRALDLPAGARVLEIGAACGALTRYLGERCALVDAVEPDPARARTARARTRDQLTVEVFAGLLDDVPAEPAYDVVVAVDVLEHAGSGTSGSGTSSTAGPGPYRRFLERIRDRLVDGGTLVLAVDNALGVRYLAGAPEERTDRVWDSVDGYARGTAARAFSRRRLEDLVTRSGLHPSTRIAFPDHTATRVVLGEVPEDCRALLYRVPALPSPDRRSPRPGIGSEYALWRQLVDARLETEFANAFVVLARKGAHDPVLWPDHRVGVFFSMSRRRELQVRTDIERVDGTVWFRRAALSPAPSSPDTGIAVRASREPFTPGTDLAEIVAARGVEAFAGFADAWLALLDRAAAEDPAAMIDLVPHNLVVDDRGDLVQIDLEFVDHPATRSQVIRRGIFTLAVRVAPMAAPSRWAPARTVGDLMAALGSCVGLPTDGSWLESYYAEELAFNALVWATPTDPERFARWQRDTAARYRAVPDRALDASPLGERVWDRHARAEVALAAERATAATLRAELAACEAGSAVGPAVASMGTMPSRPLRRFNRKLAALTGFRVTRAGAAPARPKLPAKTPVRLVTATTMSRPDFDTTSYLGRSYAAIPAAVRPALTVFADNGPPTARGLSELYNEALTSARDDEILVLVHDDVYLNDWHIATRAREAMAHVDVAGVAGSRKPDPSQPSWYWIFDDDLEPLRKQADVLSGSAGHGDPSEPKVSYYGPSPRRCQLLDGVLLVVHAGRARAAQVRFDEQFRFHFYDLDFSRTAVSAGLRVGTWPISITHASYGAFTSTAFKDAARLYLAKWPHGA